MSDENEYSGSGSFVGGSEPEAAKAPKKSSVADRQIVKNNGATVADAKNVDQTQVGKDALAISDSLGNPEPPIGSVLYGVAKEVAPYVLGGLGLKAAWDVLSSNKSQTSNDGANGGWDKTTAGKPANATLGAPAPQATTVPAAATTAAPIPQSAPATGPAPAPLGVPNPSQQVAMPGEQQPQMKYGETKYNVPTASPEVAVAPPAQAAPVAVEPKPLDPVQQAKIDKMAAETALINQRAAQDAEAHANEQRRRDEGHANRLAKDAQRAETKVQEGQGKAFNNQDNTIIANQKEMQQKAALNEQNVPKFKPAPAATEPKAIAEPVKGTNVAVASLLPPENPPATTVISEAAAPASTPVKEGVAPPKWRGGSEGSALQLFGATKKTLEPKHIAGVEVFKDFVGGELAPSTGGTIKEFPQFTEFFKKHTGETLSPNAEGKYPRLTETQVSKLHSGIQSELENAVKGGKLKTLGKGAMAAAGLLGLTEAVQAAQKGDFGPLGEAGFAGLLTKAVGGVAATALTPSEAGAPIVGNTKQQQQNIEVSQRPGVRAYAEILKNRLSGEEYNKAISDFAATNPKRGDYAAMQELFRQQAEKKKAKR